MHMGSDEKDGFSGLVADFYNAGIETSDTILQVLECSWGLYRIII
jgi:hypothetical protein